MPYLETLEEGQAFRLPGRKGERDIGELKRIGVGSCTVRIPKHDGDSYETTQWSNKTIVEPVPLELLHTQVLGDGSAEPRNKSAIKGAVGAVHDICNEQMEAMQVESKRDKVLREAILKVCEDRGINPNTAKTQYYAWRKT